MDPATSTCSLVSPISSCSSRYSACFDLLSVADSALGELPAACAGALAEEYLAVVAHQDDADIGSVTLRVDPVAHGGRFTGSHAAEQGRPHLQQNAL